MLLTTLRVGALALAVWSGGALAAPESGSAALGTAGVATITSSGGQDGSFKQAFAAWKRMDAPLQGRVSIPSVRPVSVTAMSSPFGYRVHPIDGVVKMHAGVDLPGPLGTPVYAAADGWVDRAGWAGGYGNLIELGHGGSMETRYGHLSSILVQPGQRVVRGQLIGRMGSTGHSTGSHLHYEVRIEGRPVDPTPFLQSADYANVRLPAPAASTRMAMATTGDAD